MDQLEKAVNHACTAMDEVWDLLKEGANLASMETACESDERPCHDGHTGESQAD